MNTNQNNGSKNFNTTSNTAIVTRATTSSGAVSAESQQVQQRLWVKEQEVSALKVQNRHLIAKLEDAEKSAEPNQINTQKIANEIQNQLRPLISDIQKSLVESFDILKGTMRGIYQQSQRAEKAVDDIGAHARETELRLNEQRKADQVYYQEKILSMVTSFGERIERQLENRLRNLAVVELMNTKQNEVLADVDQIKGALAELMVSNESLRTEIKNLCKETSTRNNTNIEKIAEIFSQSNQLKRDAFQEAQYSELFLKTQAKSDSSSTGLTGNEIPNEPTLESRFTLDHL
jgi:hypothetical protein